MFFDIIRSKKGFTLTEIIIVIVVLGILTAVAVPIFHSGYEKQAIKDCKNQRVVIENLVKRAMLGEIDNGKAQYKFDSNGKQTKEIGIDFAKVTENEHKTKYPGDGVNGNSDDTYNGKECFLLTADEATAFTLGELRGGYQADGTYREACANGKYLKKSALETTPFYDYLANQEIPICPFGDEYSYYIFADGTVLCSCPKCNE